MMHLRVLASRSYLLKFLNIWTLTRFWKICWFLLWFHSFRRRDSTIVLVLFLCFCLWHLCFRSVN
jgi:hypothetical protein